MTPLLKQSFLLNVICTIFLLVILSYNVEALRKFRILNGEIVKQSDLKYHVSIQRNGEHWCGGAIIDDQFILTAAHCLFKNGTVATGNDNLTVRSGTVNLTAGGFVNDVEKVMAPADYVNKYSRNYDLIHRKDIALLKLKEKLNLNGTDVEKINLPEKYTSSPDDGKIAKIAGYGYTEEALIDYDANNNVQVNGSVSPILKAIDTYIVDTTYCQSFHTRKINQKHICTYVYRYTNDDNRYGECYGDSGGPLVYNGTVVGVLSTGPPICGVRNEVATYTRVSYYLSFIHNAMRELKNGGIAIYEKSKQTGEYYLS